MGNIVDLSSYTESHIFELHPEYNGRVLDAEDDNYSLSWDDKRPGSLEPRFFFRRDEQDVFYEFTPEDYYRILATKKQGDIAIHRELYFSTIKRTGKGPPYQQIEKSERLARVSGKLEHPYPSHCIDGTEESNLVPG